MSFPKKRSRFDDRHVNEQFDSTLGILNRTFAINTTTLSISLPNLAATNLAVTNATATMVSATTSGNTAVFASANVPATARAVDAYATNGVAVAGTGATGGLFVGTTADIQTTKAMITPNGGIARQFINATGAASVKGTLVEASNVTADAVMLTAVNSYSCMGVMYSNGVANGSNVFVVVGGVAETLLKDTTNANVANWVSTSSDTGRALASGTLPSPPTDAVHFREIGHCLGPNTAGGTNVLVNVAIHFL
jgi:hypothetical protein